MSTITTTGQVNAVPCAEHSERWILAALIQRPEWWHLCHVLEAEDFHIQLYHLVVCAMLAENRALDAETILAVTNIPKEHAGELSALHDAKIILDESVLKGHVRMLLETRRDREIADANGKADRIKAVLARFDERVRIYESPEGKLRVSLAACMFRSDVRPPDLRPVFKLGGVPICTPGNLTTISAAIKAGKSAFIQAMLAATVSDKGDTFTITGLNASGHAVIHMDTEQSPRDRWDLVSRALRRAKAEKEPPWLLSYRFAGKSVPECLALLRHALADGKQEFGGIHSVLMDGDADFVCNVNDPAESNAHVAELHALAIKFDCPIIGAIHWNPNGEKTRGHLGSQLERKAETNLMLEKKDEVTVVWSDKNRRAPIPKQFGPRFRWSDDAGMHVTCEASVDPKVIAKREGYLRELKEVFTDKPAMRYADLKSTVMTVTQKNQRTAERRIEDYRQLGLIRQTAGKLYEMASF